MTLQAKLDAFKADFETGKPPYNVPPSVIETMRRATAELIASGAAARALKAHSDLSAAEIVRRSLEIAADICIYSNQRITVLELEG